jgi:RNA polymerase subunit RPABC4/transcription elongation factor Spt4
MLHECTSLVIILKMCGVCGEEHLGQRWLYVVWRGDSQAAAVATVWNIHICLLAG